MSLIKKAVNGNEVDANAERTRHILKVINQLNFEQDRLKARRLEFEANRKRELQNKAQTREALDARAKEEKTTWRVGRPKCHAEIKQLEAQLNAVRQELEKRTAKVVEQKVAKSEDQRSSVKVIEADGEKVSVMYYLKYAAAKQAAGVLNEFFAGSKEYRIAANEAQNSILIQCPPDKFPSH